MSDVKEKILKDKLLKLTAQRVKLNEELSQMNTDLGILNDRIYKTMRLLHLKTKETPYGVVRVMRPTRIVWFQDRILEWYNEKGLRPPVKKVFDPAKLEKDIERGKVKQSQLEEWTQEEKGRPYIRIDGAKVPVNE